MWNRDSEVVTQKEITMPVRTTLCFPLRGMAVTLNIRHLAVIVESKKQFQCFGISLKKKEGESTAKCLLLIMFLSLYFVEEI